MAYVELATQISTTPNEIFVFFVPQRMPLWYGTEMDAHFEVQGGASDFAVGQKVRITGTLQNYELAANRSHHRIRMGAVTWNGNFRILTASAECNGGTL